MSQEKKDKNLSGYYHNGKELLLGRKPGRPRVIRNPSYFPLDRKVEAATLYCVHGDLDRVAEITEIPIKYLRLWKQEPWWIEIQKQVYVEQNEHLAAKISSTLDTALEQLVDRLEHGDIKFNRNTGEATRQPVEAKTLATLFNHLSHHRTVVRGEPTSIKASIGVNDRLQTLQEAFLKFSSAKTIEGTTTNVETSEETPHQETEGE